MAAQQLLREVSALEDKAEALQKKLTEEQQELEKGHAKQLEQLYKRRQELVSGKALPTEEELHGSSGLSPASAAGSKGLPYFWCNVLCNQDTLAETITPRDRQALHYLTHISAASSSSSSGGGASTVELHFSTNPYFTNKVLRRGISVDEASGELQEVSTDIVWKEGKELTLKEVKGRKGKASGKKGGGKKGGGGGGKKGGGRKGGGADEDEEPAEGDPSSPPAAAADVKRKPCPSFFKFFAASGAAAAGGRGRAAELDPTALHAPEPESEEEGEEDEAPALDARVQAKLDSDSQLLQLLLREVLPRAMHLCMSGPLQGASGGSDNEGSEDSYALVHGSAGTIEDLPPALQAVAAALQHNQEQIDVAGQRRARERLSAMRAVQEEVQGLFAKRRALLLSEDGRSSRIPGFWLHVLRSTEPGALAVTRRDAAVLSQLADVRCSMVLPKAVDSRGLTEVTVALELEFLPGSPYLSTSAHPTSSSSSGKGGASKPSSTSSSPVTLIKHYTLERGGGLFEGAGWVMRTSKVVTGPHWSDADKDPTHAKPPSSSEGAQHQRKGRTICSLFHLFRPNAGKWVFNITGDDKDAQEEANQLELELLMALQQEALPHAAAAYTAADKDGSTQDGWGDPKAFDVLSEDYDSSGDEEGDHEDATERAARRAQKKAAAGGFKWTKGHMLVALMVMIVLGELLVFLDTLGWFRAPNPE